MNVLMVDDHVMFLQGMKGLLNVLTPQLRVETTRDIGRASQLVQETAFDVVLLDWHLNDCKGAEAIRRLRESGCMARIVVLSGETDSALIHDAIELGAAGFIPKEYSSEKMVEAVQQVLAGRIFLPSEAAPPRMREAPSTDARLAELTSRQMEVYRAATRGLSNKLIARQLDIAESTVKAHLSAVYSALGVRNRTEAAYQASREGLDIG
ncbi:response regulator transcription factor [Variovorax sp. J22R133]|uniref:response regulator n=1 Tax=Variovorax brevis TaxID=3053503 RepID=UPI002575C301|nr:response regulator transcription factor [Variovorax sp. J22R133]MDM0114827.1 response regulator transcription factor [Variovorax sp. J22R133]